METSVYSSAMFNQNMLTKTRSYLFATLSCMLLSAAVVQAQTGDRVSVPFSDPTRPGTLKASVLNGSITVKAYEGKEVIVEAKVRDEERKGVHGNMRRIPMTSTGLSVE